jgi:hypothetical protein
VLQRALDAYRGTGADPPFGDPARAHGTALEGYYWRIVDATAGSVVVVLCGVCQGAAGPWAAVALAAHPGGFTRHALVAPAGTEPHGFGARAASVLRGSADALSVRLGEDAWVELRLRSAQLWPRRAFGALGPAHAVPGLGQYWHPVVLAARADGEACLGGVRLRLDGATAYAEKNWGPGFAGRWWWGQSSAFPEEGLGVAFAGGALPRLGATPTAVVLWHGGQVHRFAPPLARSQVTLGELRWRVRTRSARYRLEIEGDAAGSCPHVLPVPVPGAPTVEMRSEQLLAGRLALRLSRGRRTLIESVSLPAGLEQGRPAGWARRAPKDAPRP